MLSCGHSNSNSKPVIGQWIPETPKKINLEILNKNLNIEARAGFHFFQGFSTDISELISIVFYDQKYVITFNVIYKNNTLTTSTPTLFKFDDTTSNDDLDIFVSNYYTDLPESHGGNQTFYGSVQLKNLHYKLKEQWPDDTRFYTVRYEIDLTDHEFPMNSYINEQELLFPGKNFFYKLK